MNDKRDALAHPFAFSNPIIRALILRAMFARYAFRDWMRTTEIDGRGRRTIR